MKQKLPFFLALVTIGILGRMLPHAWNTTPVLAVILFSAAYLGKSYSAWTLVVVMAVSDLILGTYQWQVMATVYVCLAPAILAGNFIQKHKSLATIVAAPVLLSTLFYLVTNWAVWQWSPLYSHNLQGLLDSYTMALPFFRNSLIGDVAYTAILFGAYEGVCALYLRVKSVRLMKKSASLIL